MPSMPGAFPAVSCQPSGDTFADVHLAQTDEPDGDGGRRNKDKVDPGAPLVPLCRRGKAQLAHNREKKGDFEKAHEHARIFFWKPLAGIGRSQGKSCRPRRIIHSAFLGKQRSLRGS